MEKGVRMMAFRESHCGERINNKKAGVIQGGGSGDVCGVKDICDKGNSMGQSREERIIMV